MTECDHGLMLEAIETNQAAITALTKSHAIDVADMKWVKKLMGLIAAAAAVVSAGTLSILGVVIGILVK